VRRVALKSSRLGQKREEFGQNRKLTTENGLTKFDAILTHTNGRTSLGEKITVEFTSPFSHVRRGQNKNAGKRPEKRIGCKNREVPIAEKHGDTKEKAEKRCLGQ